MTVPHLILLELRLRTTGPVRKLPHFHGPQWSAMLRNLLRDFLPPGQTLAEAEVCLQSVEGGVNLYEPDEPLRLGLSFPVSLIGVMRRFLADFNDLPGAEGHFQPKRTVRLEEVFCRVSKDLWNPDDPRPLTEEILAVEIDALRRLGSFTLNLHASLRATRPAGRKAESHRYLDEAYFFAGAGHGPASDSPEDTGAPLTALLQRIRLDEAASVESSDLRVTGGAGTWLDAPYGNIKGKTLGGLVGHLRIQGRPTTREAHLLVAGQYVGAGKNAPFGFGFFTIPELDAVRRIAPLQRGKTLLERAAAPEALEAALNRLPNSSPGPDGLAVADLKAAGETFFRTFSQQVTTGDFEPGPIMSYRLPKSEGIRSISVHNVAERVLHRALADQLAPVVDSLLSASSYAYRRGLSRKSAATHLRDMLAQGTRIGVKADIAAFFDSVRHDHLLPILHGLFPAEPTVDLIADWLQRATDDSGLAGLPQGGILSPVLSNLYLDRFDRDMEREGMKLVRYSDDFVVLFSKKHTEEEGLRSVRESLARLGLLLREEKTQSLIQGEPVRFLGYLVSADEVADQPKEDIAEVDEWAPVFRDEWDTGQPVYLTPLSRGARSSGAHLVVMGADDQQESVPWSRVSRIVVVGRSPFSGGVVYRAVRESIPVTFIDIMGRTRGSLHAAHYSRPDLAALQAQKAADPAFRLRFAREVVCAKIQNSHAILRRSRRRAPELNMLAARAKEATDLDQLRGYEGAAARIYFESFGGLVAPFEFRGRVYRPPDGPVNVMLSFGYTLLYHRIAAVLRDKGFDPRQGFYHQGRGTHCALASDLQEELRHVIDRIVLALIHLKEIKPEDFIPYSAGDQRTVRFTGDAFRAFVRRFEATMARKFNYRQRGQISYNGYLDEMAENLRRSLRLGLPYEALRIR